jgi:hypothetical protein
MGNMVKSKDDSDADMHVLRTSTDGLDDVDKVHGVLHAACGVAHLFNEQLCQILGQAVGWGTNGADIGPETNSFLVDLREPVHSRKPRTLWPQLLHDLLGKQ